MKRTALFLSAFVLLSTITHAKTYESVTVEKVVSVYDADTFRVNISGWPPIVGESIPIRLKHVDAPEIRGKCEIEKKWAKLGKDFTTYQLKRAKTIELRNMERGKYFRLLSEVYLDGVSLSDMLIKNNMARSYEGGTRKGWCE